MWEFWERSEWTLRANFSVSKTKQNQKQNENEKENKKEKEKEKNRLFLRFNCLSETDDQHGCNRCRRASPTA